jgi:hypothetical protein
MGSVAAMHLIGQGRKAKVLFCTIPEVGEPDGTHETTPGESISLASVGGTKEGITKCDFPPLGSIAKTENYLDSEAYLSHSIDGQNSTYSLALLSTVSILPRADRPFLLTSCPVRL